LKYIVLLFLLLNIAAVADDKQYSMRVGYGWASNNDLGEIIIGNFGSTPENFTVINLDGGYLLKKDMFDIPLDLYVKGGISRFNEKYTSDTYEGTLYLKLIYNLDFYSNRVRFGFGEGVSYADRVLEVEAIEEAKEADGGHTSRFLNYLDITVDVDLGRLVNYAPMKDVYLGYLLKHRSGVFGLYNGVSGGSNYNTIYIEKNF
jgi:outer membrane protein